MKTLNLISIAILAGVAIAAPTVERTSPTTIKVTGDYSFIDRGPLFSITTGVPIIDSVAWEDGGIVVYTVEPESEYTVHAFSFDPATPDQREQVTAVVPAIEQSEPSLDDLMYDIVKAQRSVRSMVDSGQITYFDITSSMQQAAIRLDEEQSQGVP